MHLRRASHSDVPVIAEIERSAPSPWSEVLIGAELKRADSIGLIGLDLDTGTFLGWCCVRFLPPEAELLKITVLPQHRRSGLGTLLMTKVIDLCSQNNCVKLFAEVRESNRSARGFYHRLGFLHIGMRKNYYRDPLENCLTLKLSLKTYTDNTEREGGV